MKQLALTTVLAFAFIINLNAQSTKKQDQDAIKSMCGCYEVTFNFAETFEYSGDSTYIPSKVKHDKGLEWVQLVEDDKDKISMQHLLIVGPPNNKMIVKHWRQDWEFENTDLYEYNYDNSWNYVSLPKSDVKGQWTQKVFQVDDSPRYEGSASWVHVDGKSYWENTTSAPLPRREYTKRSDYNVTIRRNRHEIVDNGWIHDQDNDKVIREEGKADVVLAQEKGFNTYVKVEDSKCKAAQDYWKENEAKWAIVRAKWSEVFARHTNLSLEEKVDNKGLFKYLFDEENYKTAEEINPLIESFVKK
ncbi:MULTISPECIES: DUF6607 family protein [Flavobacteriaceae]|jgi:hypothetical protein|uniref:Uncharacterized protein n=2 Tax=Flavobacteriaceae TaxID=49546 RepID=A0ABN1JCR9_9FLAO|nr:MULTISPECIES: DUF6607 family protein [Flavobacteriaceae]TBV25114.1 hypothetical protein DMZ43_12430 [Meridianimaribacter sp. CL38]TDY10531.1 hypothetical protein A8975_2257 [Meridianimaribacter flavus]